MEVGLRSHTSVAAILVGTCFGMAVGGCKPKTADEILQIEVAEQKSRNTRALPSSTEATLKEYGLKKDVLFSKEGRFNEWVMLKANESITATVSSVMQSGDGTRLTCDDILNGAAFSIDGQWNLQKGAQIKVDSLKFLKFDGCREVVRYSSMFGRDVVVGEVATHVVSDQFFLRDVTYMQEGDIKAATREEIPQSGIWMKLSN